MKALLAFVTFCFVTSTSFAKVVAPAVASFPSSCSEVEEAYKADLITQYDEDCAGDSVCVARQIQQLREAAKERDPKFDATMSDEQLEEHYGPGHTKLLIGDRAFEGVSLFLDFKSIVSYYDTGTTSRSSLSFDADVTYVGGKRCSSPLKPVLSYVRRKNLCIEAVAALRADHPQVKVDLGICLDEVSDFWIGNLSDDPSQAVVVVMREPQDPGETQFMCSGAIERTTNTILGVDCQVPDEIAPTAKITRKRK